MYILESLLLNLVYLLFPLTLYIVYTAYIKNMDLQEKSFFLELALVSSLYFTIKYGARIGTIFPMILFNIPLLVSYFKKAKIAQVMISIILIWYYNISLNVNIWFLISEYLAYFIVYNYFNISRKKPDNLINIFVGIKSFFISLELFLFIRPEYNLLSNVLEMLFVLVLYTTFAYIIIYFLARLESIVNLNSVMNELEKEKSLRQSLFKMTHEIKNPIAVCKGYLDMFDYHDEERIKKYIPIIKNEIERTITLMDDFLDYTKIQIDKDEIDLYMLLEDTVDSLKPLMRKNKVQTVVNIPDEEVYMLADYNRLKQVLINVFKNSLEAKRENVNMEIELDVKTKDNEALIEIRDNGVGIDKENLKYIGEMFYTTKKKGTGLGVSLSREIVNLHGGSMVYSSKKDKGTTVKITLPIIET